MKISQSGRPVVALVLFIALASFASGLVAQQGGGIPLNPAHPDSYVVKPGDTLWGISGMFLKDPWYWPEIWYVNPQVKNPHLIYPGDVLSLVYVDGKPQIRSSRNEEPSGTERLSPQIREEAVAAPIDTIPYAAIAPFLTGAMVLEKKEYDAMPYILAIRELHPVAADGYDVYVMGKLAAPGAAYSVVHVGDKLVDPDDGDVLGYEGLVVADGLVKRTGDPSTVLLQNARQEVLKGDRLAQQNNPPHVQFTPRAPTRPIEGRIIHVVNGESHIGQYNVVVINRGSRDGLEPGSVLSIWQAGQKVTNTVDSGFLGGKVQLPDEQAGTLMVFKTYDRMSYALVMQAENSIHTMDKVRNPS